MEKQEIIDKITTYVEMLYIVGTQQGLTQAGDIFMDRKPTDPTYGVTGTSGAPVSNDEGNIGIISNERRAETKTAIESSSSVVMGSDAHPVIPPIKPVDVKSITIELEDNRLVLKLGGQVRNTHTTPVAETKFTQLLMMIKDQFSNWNATNGKDN